MKASDNHLELLRARRRLDADARVCLDQLKGGSLASLLSVREKLSKLTCECSGLIACARLAGHSDLTPDMEQASELLHRTASEVEAAITGHVGNRLTEKQTRAVSKLAVSLSRRFPGVAVDVAVTLLPSPSRPAPGVRASFYGLNQVATNRRVGRFTLWWRYADKSIATSMGIKPPTAGYEVLSGGRLTESSIARVLRDHGMKV